MNKELRGTLFHTSLRSLQQHGLSEREFQAYTILYNLYDDNPAIWSQAAADKIAECIDMHRYSVVAGAIRQADRRSHIEKDPCNKVEQ